MKDQGTWRSIWGLVWPVLLYEMISTVTAIMVFRIPGIADGNASLLAIVVTAATAGPLFWRLHVKDEQRWCQWEDDRDIVPFETYYLIWAVSSCAAMALLGNVVISLTPLAEWSERFWEMQEILTSGSLTIQILATVLAAPVLEEMLVRGVLYPRMRRLFGVKAGIFLSALLFAVLHGNLVQGVYAFVLGAYFAWLMERFGSIWVPILGHMSANLFATLMGYGDFAERFLGAGSSFLMELIICAGCVGRSIQILKKE